VGPRVLAEVLWVPVHAREQRAGGIGSGEVSAALPNVRCLPPPARQHTAVPTAVLSAEAPPVPERRDTAGAELHCRPGAAEARDRAVPVSGISLRESCAFLAGQGGAARAS